MVEASPASGETAKTLGRKRSLCDGAERSKVLIDRDRMGEGPGEKKKASG